VFQSCWRVAGARTRSIKGERKSGRSDDYRGRADIVEKMNKSTGIDHTERKTFVRRTRFIKDETVGIAYATSETNSRNANRGCQSCSP
jgi:hypothetical protein